MNLLGMLECDAMLRQIFFEFRDRGVGTLYDQVQRISENSGVAPRDVRAVLSSLEGAVHGSVSKKGAGSFTLPGLLKITAVSVPAKPKRKGINPFTKEEQWFAAKPASVKVKVRPLKKLKDAAA